MKQRKIQLFKKLVRTSQTNFYPKNISQLQPYKNTDNLLVTNNRMSTVTHLKFFENQELPIVSREDKEFVELILSSAHTRRVGNSVNKIHLSKGLTNINT